MTKPITKHSFVFQIPYFHELTKAERKARLTNARCKCKLTGWWSEINTMGADDERYFAYRCQDCGRVALVDPFTLSPHDYKIERLDDWKKESDEEVTS